MPEYLTICEAAELLKVTKQTLRNWDKQGKLKPLHNRLEPTQLVDSTTSWEALYAQNKKWGPPPMS